jgi:hypothetical protein
MALPTKVVTGKIRLSYVHLFEAYSSTDDDPKFSCVLLIPKTDKVTIAALRAAQQSALANGASGTFGGKAPKSWKDTIHDGDEEADLDKNPEYAGMLYMNVSSKTRPGIVGPDLLPILDSTEVYSGCFARVSLNAFPYSNSGNQGVSFGLNHVQKLADGDFLGGRSRAEDDFDVVEDDDLI